MSTARPRSIQLGGFEAGMLRGGCWDYGPHTCCAATRFKFYLVAYRGYYSGGFPGFRACCSAPIE